MLHSFRRHSKHPVPVYIPKSSNRQENPVSTVLVIQQTTGIGSRLGKQGQKNGGIRSARFSLKPFRWQRRWHLCKEHPRAIIESAPCRRTFNTCVTRIFERHHGDKCGWRTKYWQEIHKKARWGHELEGWQITHIPVDPWSVVFSEPDTSQFALHAFISFYSFLEMPVCPSLDEQGLLHLTFINLLFLRFIFVIIHMHMSM